MNKQMTESAAEMRELRRIARVARQLVDAIGPSALGGTGAAAHSRRELVYMLDDLLSAAGYLTPEANGGGA